MYFVDSESSFIWRVDMMMGGFKLLVGGDLIFLDNLF